MQDDKKRDPAALLKQGRDAFERCKSAETTNRTEALDDIKFARLGEQWPEKIRKEREAEHRPCLTINKLPAFIRQVVNDARQNKPSIKVRAVDSSGDPKTAEVINGLIRNIEYTSNADVAYDTAIESAVSGGVGYIRIGMDYAFDDTFDMDITIERVLNPFAVYGDPNSTAADGSDWDVAFVVDRMDKADFKAKYGDSVSVDFDDDAWSDVHEDWKNDEGVLVAEWWQREEVTRTIYQMDNGQVFTADQLETDPDVINAVQTGMMNIVNQREAKTYKVTQIIMSGVDILEENEWPGRYIPIIPVYGDEFSVEGKRYFRSLINPAKDAQRMFNYWRTTSTEMVALAPRVPWIGRTGTFDSDAERWATANTKSHAYLEYDKEMPQRMPLDGGVAAGSMQEALNASDDMKSIIGMYDASMGARSNETSGRAIMARQREGDVSTFHFIDNLSRAIRQTGKIIIDLIPSVYDTPRVVRVLGEDKKESTVEVNKQTPEVDQETGEPLVDEMGQAIMALHDLTVGKYDLAVESGPSFTTRREEAAEQMTALVQAFPQAAPFVADLMAKNFDWPGADEIAKRFEQLNPAKQKDQIPPEMQAQMEQGMKRIEELERENQELKASQRIDEFEAETKRAKVVGDLEAKRAQLGYEVIKDVDGPQQNYPVR